MHMSLNFMVSSCALKLFFDGHNYKIDITGAHSFGETAVPDIYD